MKNVPYCRAGQKTGGAAHGTFSVVERRKGKNPVAQ